MFAFVLIPICAIVIYLKYKTMQYVDQVHSDYELSEYEEILSYSDTEPVGYNYN
jgi:hypothetical protein